MPTTLDTTPTRSLAHRRAALADRLAHLRQQIRGLDEAEAYPDAPRRPAHARMQAAAEALAAGHDVVQPPTMAELRREAQLVQAALNVLDAQAAAERLTALAGTVETQTASLRKALSPWVKWVRAMPSGDALRDALDDLRAAHLERQDLARQVNGQPVERVPVFDDLMEHCAARALELAERVDVLVKDCDEARL